ncbi:MAG: trypsin-like peptidase domain-containing protein [Frankiaceae bacterium]
MIAALPGGREQVGSGYLVGGRLVLTAEHCTRDKASGHAALGLRVVRASDGHSVDVVEVVASPAVDVAALRLTDVPWDPVLPAPVYARVDRTRSGMRSDCEAIGYPLFQRDPDRRARHTAELHGTIYQTDEAEAGRLLLREPLLPGVFRPDPDGTLAYELAAVLEGVLVDFDHDAGAVTGRWGYSMRSKRSILLDAFERGPDAIPHPRTAPRRPALLPGHVDLDPATSQVPHDLVTDCLVTWASSPTQYRCLVVDTHPGGGSLADGARRAANHIVVPATLGRDELRALEAMVSEHSAADYPMLIAPNRIPARPAATWIRRLIAAAGPVPIGPVISNHSWLGTRLRRSAITLEPNPSGRVKAAATEFGDLADAVWRYRNA